MNMQQVMPDVQSTQDLRSIPIQKVGVRGVKHPINVNINGIQQTSVGDWTMTVFLPATEKGTHMSRFLVLLDENREQYLSPATFITLTRKMQSLLHTTEAHLQVKFPYFMRKTAPVSGIASTMDYQLTWEACVGRQETFELTVVLPVMSLCPCSKAISQYGAHNQRSYITVRVQCDTDIDINAFIRALEEQGSCQIWGLLKRPDEKYVTEHSYENPKFVEDLIRDMAGVVQKWDGIQHYCIEAENMESIHNHSAYAYISA